MAKLLTFGETILRIQAPEGSLFFEQEKHEVYFGGSELNITIFAHALGLSSDIATLVPKNALGERLLTQLRKHQLPLKAVQAHPGAMATYFVEQGKSPRKTQVLARQTGALGLESDYHFEWQELFQNVTMFHSSGITAGIGAHSFRQLKEAMTLAKEKKITNSYDFNFRSNVWSFEDAKKIQKELLPLIDIMFLGEKEIEVMLDGPSHLRDAQKFLFESYPFQYVIMSRRATNGDYGLTLLTADAILESKSYALANTERIGSGDAMTAAFLYGLSQDHDLQSCIDFAAFCAALKQTLKGDFLSLDHTTVRSLYAESKQQGFWR